MAPSSRIDKKRAEIFIGLVEEKLKTGHPPPGIMPRKGEYGAIRAATMEMGFPIGSTRSNYEICIRLLGREPDWSLWRDPNYVHYEQIHTPAPNPDRPVVRIKAPSQPYPEGPQYRVLVIGDCHDSPVIPDKSRFKWIGSYAAEHRIPYIVQIGDWGTIDSCSQYDDYGTVSGATKPSYADDIESLEESVARFIEPFPKDYKPDRMVTKGNHENRAMQWENAHPEVAGQFALQIDQAFGRGGFRTVEYGAWYFLGGVGFTHVPFNIMGKPYSGKMPENMIANDAMFSIVYGHTHKRVTATRPKIGPQKRITICNVGCALPHGHVEEYARMSMTGWSYGIVDMLIQGGDIIAEKFISMIELEKLYG